MKTFKMTRMSGRGDQLVREWDETATPEALQEIEREFAAKMKEGYFAADLGTNALMDGFKPDTDILLIPKLQGGRG